MPFLSGNSPFILPPTRIVSLVPSLTELLYDLDLGTSVVGITKFCVHPDNWFRTKTRVGGTKNPNLDQIVSLQPDLIITSKEENNRSDVELLAAQFPVLLTDIHDLSSALQAIQTIGLLTDRLSEAQEMISRIQTKFSALTPLHPTLPIAYFIWKEPYLTAGGDTFIHDMITRAGFRNVFAAEKRYPEINPQDITDRHTRFLFLSSEPYPFRTSHLDAFSRLFPGTLPILVDGEYFSWYGSRLLKAPAYFAQLQSQVLSLSDGQPG